MAAIQKLAVCDKPDPRLHSVMKGQVRLTLTNSPSAVYYQCSGCQRLLARGEDPSVYVNVAFLCPSCGRYSILVAD